jgi:hypothetical protein
MNMNDRHKEIEQKTNMHTVALMACGKLNVEKRN